VSVLALIAVVALSVLAFHALRELWRSPRVKEHSMTDKPTHLPAEPDEPVEPESPARPDQGLPGKPGDRPDVGRPGRPGDRPEPEPKN
jgi:hypothetical protein